MRLLLSALFLLATVVTSANSAAAPAPKDIDPNEVVFYLYTRDNPFFGQVIDYDFSGDLSGTNWNPSRPTTYFIVHGWNSDIQFAEHFTEDLLAYEDCNIIGVDWGVLAPWTNYFEAARNALEVGTFVGEFVNRMVDQANLNRRDIHAIGHSLGAQALGHLGRSFENLNGNKVPRLTGLDPAKPYFDAIDESLSLNKNDGEFVDIIHTNSGDLVDGCLSFMKQMGHIDFYPNGGEHQPGCTEVCPPGGCTEGDLIDLIKGGCSHSRSWQYFVESINGGDFTGTECGSWLQYDQGSCGGGATQLMGLPCTSSPGEGQYWLHVGSEPPFSMG